MAKTQRTLQGVEVTNTVFRRAITDFIGSCPQGTTLGAIAKHLGPEHEVDPFRSILRKLLQVMKADGLVRLSDHLYSINARQVAQGVTRADQWEIAVIDTVRELGGVARSAEILWDIQHETYRPYRLRFPRVRRIGGDYLDTPSKNEYA